MTTSADPGPGDVLIGVGRRYPGVRVCESELHPLLIELAGEAADLQARFRRCGHISWGSRAHRIQAELRLAGAEIAAQSWARQRDDPLKAIAEEMFNSWRQSEGHWRVASVAHRFFGAAMSRGRNGIWYAAIVVAD